MVSHQSAKNKIESQSRTTNHATGSGSRLSPVVILFLLALSVVLMNQFKENGGAGQRRDLLATFVQSITRNITVVTSSTANQKEDDARQRSASGKEDDDERPTPTSSLSLLELSRASQKHHDAHFNCTWPFVVVRDRIVVPEAADNTDDVSEEETLMEFLYDNYTRKIPQIIHMAWIHEDSQGNNKGRCLHHLQANAIEMWKKRLPNYAIVFHDDYSVAKLMEQSLWPEFPHLSKLLQCVKMRNAMLIDIWRVMVLYHFGGFYTDMDQYPTSAFTRDLIPKAADFFSFSDSYGRPSQWGWAISPGHPVGYYTMEEILHNLWEMQDITRPKVVFTTGPDALKHGYARTFYWKKDEIFKAGYHYGMYNTTAFKIGADEVGKYVYGWQQDPYNPDDPYNNGNTTHNNNNWTLIDQIKKDTGAVHWTEQVKHIRRNSQSAKEIGPCRDYLYGLERSKKSFRGAGITKSDSEGLPVWPLSLFEKDER